MAQLPHHYINNTMLVLGFQDYSGHSFCRRGATHALNCGVMVEIIKAQGNWKSLAYLDYLDTTDAPLYQIHSFYALNLSHID